MISYGRHYIDSNDIKSVLSVLKNKPLTQGKFINYFEDVVREYVGSKYAVAVSSCTAGLHIAYRSLNLSKKDKVLVPSITFVSTANAALFSKNKVEFVDTNSKALIDLNKLEQKLRKNKNIKLIVPVHFAGWTCDMVGISELAKKYNCFVIEDSAHALGSSYENTKKVGSCFYSDMSVFSFHPVKTIATGEGGMVTTNNKEIYKSLLRLRSHGINKLDDKMINRKYSHTGPSKNPWYYEMQELGYNYRLTDIQSALGLSQMKKINKFLVKRRNLYKKYLSSFKKFKNLSLLHTENIENSSCHLCVIKINFDAIKKSRSQIMNYLKKKGIITQVHYIPLYLHPYFKIDEKLINKNFNLSFNYYSKCLSIPLFYNLKQKDQKNIIKILYKIIG